MTKDEYNAKVQEIQAMWPPEATRFRTGHSRPSPDTNKLPELLSADFQVYWDGWWRTLGTQRFPFRENAEYEWDEDSELKMRVAFASALARS